MDEKTQLGKVVSLPKGFGRYFCADEEKSIFRILWSPPWAFTQEMRLELNF